jgi:hypothetical protein
MIWAWSSRCPGLYGGVRPVREGASRRYASGHGSGSAVDCSTSRDRSISCKLAESIYGPTSNREGVGIMYGLTDLRVPTIIVSIHLSRLLEKMTPT